MVPLGQQFSTTMATQDHHLQRRYTMTSLNGNIFRVTGHLCGEFTGPRWIPRTKASDAELWLFFFMCTPINSSVNNGEDGDLRRHRTHYGVTIMNELILIHEHLAFVHFNSTSILLIFTETVVGQQYKMKSSNGNIFRVTGHLCGEFTGPRWIPRTKASDVELWCFLWSASE